LDVAQERFERWVEALRERALTNLRFPELRRAVQALSSLYVEQRGQRLRAGAAFDTAGKRAAYAAFYAPLHFLTIREVLRGARAGSRPAHQVLDLGCGTGAAGAAWSLACGGKPALAGVDRSGWAVDETRWTWPTLGLKGVATRGNVAQTKLTAGGIIAAYCVNELDSVSRARLLANLLDAARHGAEIWIVEPISRTAAPWWNEWADAFRAQGGESRDHKFRVQLPSFLAELDHAAGLDHRELTARTLRFS